LITKTPNQINQQALSDCNIQVAKYTDIQALYQTCPDIERATRMLAEQFFVQKEQREIEIVLLDAGKRYQIFQKKLSATGTANPPISYRFLFRHYANTVKQNKKKNFGPVISLPM
jgi:hypothetical protein